MGIGPAPTTPLPPECWYVDIEKMLNGEYWTNRYVVRGANLAEAHAAGQVILGYERLIHANTVLFVKWRTSDGKPNTDTYAVSNSNLFGGRALGPQLFPLFNVIRVDFNTEGGGRPSRKYLRGCLNEEEVDFNALQVGLINLVNNNYASALAGFSPYVDVDNQELIAGSVYPFVGMRQLRRGSKRKKTITGPTT